MGAAIAEASEKECLAWLSSQYKELVGNETSFSCRIGRVEKTDTLSVFYNCRVKREEKNVMTRVSEKYVCTDKETGRGGGGGGSTSYPG